MNRLLTSTITLIIALYLINPCSAEETTSSEHDFVSKSETLTAEESEVFTKAEPIDFKDNYQDNKELISDTAAKSLKKEDPESFWIEKLSGKKLNTLKSNLEELQNIYNKNYRTFCIGETINNIEKAEPQQNRNNSLLLNISRQQPFSLYAASYIFPELLKINLEHFSNNLLETEKNLTDEISETTEEINNLITKISENIQKYRKVEEAYQKLFSHSEEVIKNLKKTNDRLNNLTSIGFYAKKKNSEILEVISKQIDSIGNFANQLEYAIDYSERQITFINQHNHGIAEKVKYITEIRSSFKDLNLFFESLDAKEKYNFYLFNKIYSEYHDNLKQLIGTEEIRSGRINSFVKNSKFTQIPKSIDLFNAKDDLNNIFKLLDFPETDEKLYSVLLPYISNESWQCRYKEENEANKDKNEAKPKPKLIDFEEE